jgi:FHA domain
MTTYARSSSDLADRPTAPFDVPEPDGAIDALDLLDDHSRSRTKHPTLARPGPHLELGDADEARLLPLEPRITHIGRGLTADVRLADPRISRSHAIVVRHGRYARLLDNRSSTGTFVNGRRVLAANLRDGDVIAVGPVTLRYVEVE